MRLSDVALGDYDWMKEPPRMSAASRRISRHLRQIKHEQEAALEVPLRHMTAEYRAQSMTDEQHSELLAHQAKKAKLELAKRLMSDERAEREDKESEERFAAIVAKELGEQ